MTGAGCKSASSNRPLYILLGVLAVVVAAVTFTLPDVEMLDSRQFRLAVFHGADTWANLALFTLAALASAAYIVSSRKGLYHWATGFRHVAMPLWLFNAALGLLSAMLTWSGFSPGELFAEPKLMGTFYVLLGSTLIVGIDSVLAKPKLTAVLDIAMGGALWYLILSASNYMHPDNPMRNPDTDPGIKLRFFVMAGGLLAFWMLVSYLVKKRAAAHSEGDGGSAERTAVLPADEDERETA